MTVWELSNSERLGHQKGDELKRLFIGVADRVDALHADRLDNLDVHEARKRLGDLSHAIMLLNKRVDSLMFMVPAERTAP